MRRARVLASFGRVTSRTTGTHAAFSENHCPVGPGNSREVSVRSASRTYPRFPSPDLMIACTAFAHLDWDAARRIELGPYDYQRKLGEALPPRPPAPARSSPETSVGERR